jgi:hypothetical protein
MARSSKPSLKELLEKGNVVEVTSLGTICGLDEYEYCVQDKCRYWDDEKKECKLFIWASIMYEGKYHTVLMTKEKARNNVKLARFQK